MRKTNLGQGSQASNILRLVTVIVEEDQINTPTYSPGAFIRQNTQMKKKSR